MAQSNYSIANESAPAVRAQLNAVFQSIATNNSGTSPPATTFPHQWWYDTTTNILKQRNASDSAWIDVGIFDQSEGTFAPVGVQELSQGQVEDDTDDTFGLVSGERLAQHSDDYAENFAFGVDQEWVDVTSFRNGGIIYQNTTDKTIQVHINGWSNPRRDFQVRPTSSDSWVPCGALHDNSTVRNAIYAVVPSGHQYRLSGVPNTLFRWSEYR